MTVEDLRDRLERGEVDLTALTVEVLNGLVIKKPDVSDYIPLTAAHVLRDLGRYGLNLFNLPSAEELLQLVDVAWYEREDDQVTTARQALAEVESWDADRAEAEAEARYQWLVQLREEQYAKYGPALERARSLRAAVIALDPSRAEPSAETMVRLRALHTELLARVDLAVYQLTTWIGDSPTHMSGAEYRRSLIAKHTQTIEKASERGSKEGKVAQALELLQALARMLHTPDPDPA